MNSSIYPDWILKAFEESGKKPRIITHKELDKSILYGTFGKHANEPAEDILMRKIPETDGELGSLWGVKIDGKRISEYTEFCSGIKGNVYALLKFTDYERPGEDSLFLKCMYNGEEKVLADYGIKVIGNEKQSAALVVEEYCLFEDLVAYTNVKNCYKPYTDSQMCSRTPLTMVVRNSDVKLNLKACDKTKDRFAIVLKLKAPYVVQCFDHKKGKE